MTVANGNRVIITADWLLDQYRGKGLTMAMLSYLIAPFLMDDPVAEFDRRMAEAKELVQGEEYKGMSLKSKEEYIEMWALFKSGYSKMSVFEQKALQKDLLPKLCERAMKGELL